MLVKQIQSFLLGWWVAVVKTKGYRKAKEAMVFQVVNL